MKTLFKLLSALLVAHSSWLTAQNSMSLTSAEAHPNDVVTIELSVSNAESFVAFQTEIPLGENLSYVGNSAVLYRNADHQLVASVVDGTLKLYAFSFSGQAFAGNEGKIASFQLKLGKEPGNFTLAHTKAKLVDAAGNALQLSTNDGSVLVLTPKAQITTSQIDYGHVPIRSSYNRTLSVMNVGNEPLTISELLLSDATLTCLSFEEKVINAGSTASFTIVYSPMIAGAVSHKITVVSDASNGNQVATVIANPYSVNELHLYETSAYCDSIIDFSISVNNMDQFVGFQLNIKMPEAIQYQTDGFELTSRKTDHICTASMRNDTLVLMAYSPSNSAFTGEDGVVANIKLKIKGNSGWYYLCPDNVIIVNGKGDNVLSDSYCGYIEVKSPKISAGSTHQFSASSVTEPYTEYFNIANYGNAPLRIDSVKFFVDYLSCDTEFPLVINSWENANIALTCNKETEGDFTAAMNIYSNDPTNGMHAVKVQGRRYEPNGLSIDNVAITSEKYVDVLINMDNYSEITAIQVDFTYPNADFILESSDFSLTERCQGLSMTATRINDSTFKIIMFSMSNAIISGNEGAIVKIRLNKNENSDCDNATICLKNIILSDVKGSNKNTFGNQIKKIELFTTIVIELKQGWNWFSTNININGEEGFKMLKQSLADNAIVVKSQTDFTKYYDEYDMWSGSLETFDNSNLYKINMLNEHTVVMTGILTDASNFSMTLMPGWNWISYPLNEEMNLNEIDFGFTPKQGDYIKSQNKFAKYYDDYGWSGSLEIMKPGEGYIYNNTDEIEKTLSYSRK